MFIAINKNTLVEEPVGRCFHADITATKFVILLVLASHHCKTYWIKVVEKDATNLGKNASIDVWRAVILRKSVR